jgi:hypothetical protein
VQADQVLAAFQGLMCCSLCGSFVCTNPCAVSAFVFPHGQHNEAIACQHDLQALEKSGVAREEIFITTKIHPRHLGYQATLRAFESSLSNFSTDFIDLVLLHYAECWGTICDSEPEGNWKESWRALEELVVSGKVLAIGASCSCSKMPFFRSPLCCSAACTSPHACALMPAGMLSQAVRFARVSYVVSERKKKRSD